MVIDKNKAGFSDFLLENDKIEEVEEFTILGSVIDAKCSSAKEIEKNSNGKVCNRPDIKQVRNTHPEWPN